MWDGSSAAVGMAATPLGAHPAGIMPVALIGVAGRLAGADRPPLLTVLPNVLGPLCMVPVFRLARMGVYSGRAMATPPTPPDCR